MPDHLETKTPIKRPKKIKYGQPVFTMLIRGDRYSVYLHPLKELAKLVSGAQAYIKFEDKEMRFSEENLTLSTITHELIHAYIASTYIHELEDLDKDCFEEIICEVVSRHYEKLGSQAKLVKKALELETVKRRNNT